MEINLNDWPLIEGRYKVGNKTSAVAVCTNATVEGINLDMEKVAIVGKCVTENIGLEKIIQNVVSNPYLKFLILCGRVSKGHFVSQAIISLKENGLDSAKRIIGAKGNMPYLKGIDENLIERFRQQIEPINMEGEKNSANIMQVIENCLGKKSEVFAGEAIEIKQVEEIEARACPKWLADPRGYFVIALDRGHGSIIVEHYNENKLVKKIIGASAEEISKTIGYLDLIGNFEQTREHAMYLGRELQKAELALKNNLDFEQDLPLLINKEEKINKKETPIDEGDWFD